MQDKILDGEIKPVRFSQELKATSSGL